MRTHPPFARAAPRIAAPSRDARARRSGPAALRGLPARRATDAAHTRRAAALRGAGAAPAGAGRAGEPRRLTPRPAAPGPAPASPRRRPQARPGSAPRPAAHCPRPGGSRGPALLPGRARGLLLRAFGREPRNCDPAPPSAPRHSDPPRPGASQRFQPVHLCRRLTGERASEAAEMRLLSPEEVSPEECCMRTR